MIDYIKDELNLHLEVIKNTIASSNLGIEKAADEIVSSLRLGGKLIIFGNGGSAADAQHMAAEFTGRFLIDRKALAAIALTTDTSALTAIANDFGYENIFSRQIDAICQKNDVVLGITTSGNSLNIINGIKAAEKIGCRTIGLTGNGGGDMADLVNTIIDIPSKDTPRIQEMHILIIHILCGIAEKELS